MADVSDGIGIPKGGGALSGIGETFQPDLHTGTAHLKVPVPLPPGRGALTPKLALGYSSGTGNGPFGIDWSLDVPRISRRTDRSVPMYDDTRDTFVLSGAEELVEVPIGNAAPPDLPADASATRYRPRTEAGFARIVHVVGAGSDYWDLWTRDGLRSRYGTLPPPNAPDDWSDPATIRTPDGNVFAWLLSITSDTFGSRTRYSYRNDDTGNPQRYLAAVEYAEYGDLDDPSYAVTVSINYDDSRPDPFSDRRPGFELRTTLRATQIAVGTIGSAGSPVTTVDVTYGDADVSLLTGLHVTGHDPAAGTTQSLPPLTFDYSGWNPAARRYRPLPSTLPPTPLGTGIDLVDVFGDGLPSVIELGTMPRYWRNLGNGRFDLPRPLTAAPPAALGTSAAMFTDLNGDGRPELVTSANRSAAVWSLTPTTEADVRAGFQPRPSIPTAKLSTGIADPTVRLVDLDGDHLLDLLASGSPPLAADGDGNGNFTLLRPLPAAPAPLTNLTDPRVRIVDMTGDGLADIVLVHDGSIRYWPSLGRGRYGPPVEMTNAPHFTDALAYPGSGFDPRRLLLGDITGKGPADAVYVDDGSVTIWLNLAGNGFGPATVIRGTPRVDTDTDVRLADIDGLGVAGVLWSGIGTNREWAFLDLTGGVKPYLLTGLDNHRGAATTLTWSTSTAFAVADRSARTPWRTVLPFPVHVLAASESTDYFSATVLTSAYRYHEGYWDVGDREFRGFGCVEQTDTLALVTAQQPAPADTAPLDPLVPATPLPSVFDSAAAGNLLRNWSFDNPRPGLATTTLTTTPDQPFAGGMAAADGWTTWNNAPTTTTTELRPSTLPQGHDGSMIHVTTGAGGCGIVQTFGAEHAGPARVDSSAWIYVVTGSVLIGTGDGGNIAVDATIDRTGQWTLVSAGNQRTPANEFIVYSANSGNCEFYVDHAWVRAADVPPEPLTRPPVRTVTWFHLGPVGPVTGAWTDLDFSDRYWADDPPLRPHLDTSALPASTPRPALREAIRGARGRILRSETYCDDGTPLAARPYEVHDAAFEVVPVTDGRGVDDPSWQATPVVVVRETLSRSAEWDRGNDPLIHVTATGGYDGYNRPGVTASIGVARGRDPRATGGDPSLATVTMTQYATRDDTTAFLLDCAAATIRREAVDPATTTIADFADAALVGEVTGELRAVDLTYYDGIEFVGLPVGSLGDHGLPVRTEHLVLTPERLAEICAPVVPGGSDCPLPPYLDNGVETATWPPEYPPAFATAVEQAPETRGAHLGYAWHDAADPVAAGWYATSSQLCYDFQAPVAGRSPRGLVLTARDAYGGDTEHDWDEYDLLLKHTSDPVGLPTSAEYDYRLFKPSLVTDPNGNRTAAGYTPLGLPAWVANLGKDGANEGDTVEQPGRTFNYDLDAWDRTVDTPDARGPMNVSIVRRIDHRWTLVQRENERRVAAGEAPLTDAEIAAMFPATEIDDYPERFIRSIEFTDGLGRLLQTRTQADELTVSDVGLPWDITPAARTATADPSPDAPRVVVSGWQTYDNKGHAVVTREPFYDAGYGYAPPDAANLQSLAAVRQHYDPRGRKTVTVAPDGSQTRVVYGVPDDQHHPESATPTPWETWTYDPNDNAGRTHPTSDLPQSDHWDTPSSSEIDALGRTICTVRRGLATDVVTTVDYDIDGNPTAVTDPLGRTTARTVYDHTGKAWTVWLLDAGTARSIYDAAGGVAEHRDDKGALTLTAYDAAHRHVLTWAANHATQDPTLRGVTIYGDDTDASGLTQAHASLANLLGRVTVSLDDAGRAATSAYDLDGNATATARQILRPDLLLSTLPSPGSGPWSDTAYIVDWQVATGQTLAQRAAELLDPTAYETISLFDALGRATYSQAPSDVTGARAAISYQYGRGGGITAVTVDGQPYVQTIAYDAHGRRSLAHLGNGTLLRYAYDPTSLRLRRVRAEHATRAAGEWICDGPVLQDITYRFDQSGNPLTIGDRTPGCGILTKKRNVLNRQFRYDPLDRLIRATGRETAIPAQAPPWDDQVRSWDVTKARGYTEAYTYDVTGNLTNVHHKTGASGVGAYRRDLPVVDGSNRLKSLSVGRLVATYAYDPCGNMLTEAANRSFEWDHANRLATFRDQIGPQQPTMYAQYRYDAAGSRVAKLVRRSSGPDEITLYLGGFERLLIGAVGGSITAYDEVHLTDHDARLALIRRGSAAPSDGLADHDVLYQLGDHLGSVTVTLGADAELVNREEYLPYGETAFGSYARKRYRYTGTERDSESGLAYHQRRYYMSWACRWPSCDDLPSSNPYTYCSANPISRRDPGGREPEPPGYGRYGSKAIRGDHVHQVASRTTGPGTKRETAKEFRNALSRNTTSYNDLAGQQFERQANQAAWKDVAGPPGEKVQPPHTARSTGNTTVGTKEAPQPSQWFENQKSYGKIIAAGDSPDVAYKAVSKSADQLNAAEATPMRVPYAPQGTSTTLQGGQQLSREMPLSEVQKHLPPARTLWSEVKAAAPSVLHQGAELARGIGFLMGLIGSYNLAKRNMDQASPGLTGLNQGATFIVTFIGVEAAAGIDDAMAAANPAYGGVVNDSWEHEGGGPAQLAVANFILWGSR